MCQPNEPSPLYFTTTASKEPALPSDARSPSEELLLPAITHPPSLAGVTDTKLSMPLPPYCLTHSVSPPELSFTTPASALPRLRNKAPDWNAPTAYMLPSEAVFTSLKVSPFPPKERTKITSPDEEYFTMIALEEPTAPASDALPSDENVMPAAIYEPSGEALTE